MTTPETPTASTITFERDGCMYHLMVSFESPRGDYGGSESDERDATPADLIAALSSNAELRAGVLGALLPKADPAVLGLRKQTAARERELFHAQLQAFIHLGDLLQVSPGSNLHESVPHAIERRLELLTEATKRAEAAEATLAAVKSNLDHMHNVYVPTVETRLEAANAICRSRAEALEAAERQSEELRGQLSAARAELATERGIVEEYIKLTKGLRAELAAAQAELERVKAELARSEFLLSKARPLCGFVGKLHTESVLHPLVQQYIAEWLAALVEPAPAEPKPAEPIEANGHVFIGDVGNCDKCGEQFGARFTRECHVTNSERTMAAIVKAIGPGAVPPKPAEPGRICYCWSCGKLQPVGYARCGRCNQTPDEDPDRPAEPQCTCTYQPHLPTSEANWGCPKHGLFAKSPAEPALPTTRPSITPFADRETMLLMWRRIERLERGAKEER